MPCRRVLWIVMFVIGIAALLYAGGESYVDDYGVLHDSFLMPVGAVMALLAIVVSALDALLTLKQKI